MHYFFIGVALLLQICFAYHHDFFDYYATYPTPEPTREPTYEYYYWPAPTSEPSYEPGSIEEDPAMEPSTGQSGVPPYPACDVAWGPGTKLDNGDYNPNCCDKPRTSCDHCHCGRTECCANQPPRTTPEPTATPTAAPTAAPTSTLHCVSLKGKVCKNDPDCEWKHTTKTCVAAQPPSGTLPEYVGCFVENSGSYARQKSPQWCSSMERCQCPSQFPYVGYTNGNTDWASGAEWSCFYELPPTKTTGCTTRGDWHVGARGWKTSIYKNPASTDRNPEWLTVSGGSFYLNLNPDTNWSEYYPSKTTWAKVRLAYPPRCGDQTVTVDLTDFTFSTSRGGSGNHHGIDKVEWGVAMDCRYQNTPGHSDYSLDLMDTPFRVQEGQDLGPGGWTPWGSASCYEDGKRCSGSCGGACGWCGFGHAGTYLEDADQRLTDVAYTAVLTVIDRLQFDEAVCGASAPNELVVPTDAPVDPPSDAPTAPSGIGSGMGI